MANPATHILKNHQQVVQRMLTQDKEIANLFNKFIRDVSPLIGTYQSTSTGSLMYRDSTLDRKIKERIEGLNKEVLEYIETNQKWAWNTTDLATDKLIQEYTKGMALSEAAQQGLFARNTQAMAAFMKRRVVGMGLSDRVWKIGKDLRDQLEFYVTSGISQGRSAEKIGRDIRQILNEPDKVFRRVRDPNTGKLVASKPMKDYHPGRGVYRSSRKNALRLARTETNMAYHEANYERWQNLDFVVGYEVRLSNSHARLMPHGDICDELAGRYPKNFKFIGWHPQCMCHAIPIMNSREDFMNQITGDATGQPKQPDMPENFKKWLDKNRDRVAGWKNQPYFIRDNFVGGDINKGLKATIKGGPTPKPKVPPKPKPKPSRIPKALTADFIKGTDIKLKEDFFELIDQKRPVRLNIVTRGKDVDDSFFTPRTNTVTLGNGRRMAASKWEREAVIYHEYGHAIDQQRILLYSQNTWDLMKKATKILNEKKRHKFWKRTGFKMTGPPEARVTRPVYVYKEKNSFGFARVDQRLRDLKDKAFRMSPETFKKRGITREDFLEQIGSAQDALMALNPRYGWGHSQKYMSVAENRNTEFIAHAFENVFVGNQVFEKVMPEIYDMMVEFIKELKPIN